jgi:integrase/recombinase XerC
MKLTIATAFRSFDDLVRRKSSHTKRAYRSDLADFAKWRKTESPAHALYDLLQAGRLGARRQAESYRGHLAGKRELAQATVRRRIAALQAFVSRAYLDELVDWKLAVEAATNLSKERRRASSRRDMSGPRPEDLKHLRAVLRHDRSLAGLRDAAIIALLENPMLRASEVVGLDVSHVDLKGRSVTIIGKGRVETEKLPIPAGTAEDLAAWVEARAPLGPGALFVLIQRTRRVREGSRWHLLRGHWLTPRRLSTGAVYQLTLLRGRNAGIKRKVRPHGLRHTGITMLVNHCAEHGIPLTEAMAVTRHRKLETLLGYLDRQGEKRRALVEAISLTTR